MEAPVEFSSFYRLLNAIKEGQSEQKELLAEKLKSFEIGKDAKSHLHELGELFIFLGVKQIYKYADQDDLQVIGKLTKEEWEEIADKKESDLPKFLASAMIKYTKENDTAKTLSKKWNKPPREINKHITKMARYVTEGLLDVLE